MAGTKICNNNNRGGLVLLKGVDCTTMTEYTVCVGVEDAS